MARRKRRKKVTDTEPEDLNMTPMIDIVFQLLIFFMLTLQFKETEGKLMSQLPKDKGLAPSSVIQPEFEEVRIVICAGGNNPATRHHSWQTHIHNKGAHEKLDKPNSQCVALVGQVEIGILYLTAEDETKKAHNLEIYKRLGIKAAELYQMTPSTKDASKRAPVILDADSEAPYEHVIGVVNSCKENNIDNIEFVGNPRHEKYYGSYKKGQFKRN